MRFLLISMFFLTACCDSKRIYRNVESLEEKLIATNKQHKFRGVIYNANTKVLSYYRVILSCSKGSVQNIEVRFPLKYKIKSEIMGKEVEVTGIIRAYRIIPDSPQKISYDKTLFLAEKSNSQLKELYLKECGYGSDLSVNKNIDDTPPLEFQLVDSDWQTLDPLNLELVGEVDKTKIDKYIYYFDNIKSVKLIEEK